MKCFVNVASIFCVGVLGMGIVAPVLPGQARSGQARSTSSASGPAKPSAYVPLDDNAYVYADALIARGLLKGLSLLERPYRVTDFQRALYADTSASPRIQALQQRLAEALVKYDIGPAGDKDGIHLSITPYIIATEQTSGVRDLMRADSTHRFRPGIGGIAVVQGGPVIVAGRAYSDRRLKDDPTFIGQTNRKIVGRMEDAYISAQFRYGEAFFGRLGRNWGPSQPGGLMVGNSAYTYDQAYIKLGVPTFRMSTIITRLDDVIGPPGVRNDTARRYVSMHQLAARFGDFEIGVNEAAIYGGKSENLRLAYANPIVPYALAQVVDRESANILVGFNMAYRSGIGNFSLEGALDELIKDHCEPACTKPNSFAFTLGAEGVPLFGKSRFNDQRVWASYTLVSNLMYRNPHWWENYTSENVGLARGYSDYDEIRGGLDLLLIPGMTLRPYVAYSRQGEGDYRIPHPQFPVWNNTKQFLEGTVQHTTRLGITGAGSIARFVHLSGDLGVNREGNSQHVAGATQTRFVGRVSMVIESPWRWAWSFSAE